ncbi:MAG: FMN-binding negative transcriptional regulator [Acidiferrobacteraceae bacterium]
MPHERAIAPRALLSHDRMEGFLMYNPEPFREQRLDRLREAVDRNPFGLLISRGLPEPVVTHLPMLLESGPGSLTVIGHMARANPHAEILRSEGRALIVFPGPHAYVSPFWYETPGVPTWNYIAVHLRGRVRVVDDTVEVRGLIERLTARFEAEAAREGGNGLMEWFKHLLPEVVGFIMDVDEMEGKFKLSQNRPPVDQARVAGMLRRSPRSMDQELAAWMDRVSAEAGADSP